LEHTAIGSQSAKPWWAVWLFNKSVLKQEKFRQIITMLGATEGLHCLDLGSDNGVISYLLRQRGGTWKSADVDPRSVRAMHDLVQTDVFQLAGETTPFSENEFDRVVVVDLLEHVQDDAALLAELYRILKPDGTLIVNVPHIKEGFLSNLRLRLGLTDEEHGHVRPGYTVPMIEGLFSGRFQAESHRTYTKFFSKLLDSLLVYAMARAKGFKRQKSQARGVLVTDQEIQEYGTMFRMYGLIYPLFWLLSKLDNLVPYSGYMLIVKARSEKTS
jgi:ubiquinone/menaquinone biosynthesis C-methylase UbiE